MNNETNKIDALLNSPAFRAAEAAADAERVELHAAAVDALLVHEAATAELERAQAHAENARGELLPIEAAYFAARQKLAAASADVIRIGSSRELQSNKLRAEAAKHLPQLMARTENALRFVEGDVRAAFGVREWQQPGHFGRLQSSDNSEAVNAALEQCGKLRDLLGHLGTEPMASDAVTKLLSAEALRLIELGKVAGAMVAHHLPEEVRHGVPSEKPERTEPAQYFAEGCHRRLVWTQTR